MDAIKNYHPVVSFSFFMLMILISLASMQPFFQAICFTAAVGYSLALSGIRSFLKSSWWLLVLVVVVIFFNSVFVGRGLTVLFVLNLGFIQTPITVEALVYGVCMGLMLANVILWFRLLGKLSSMQGFIELFAKVSPTAAMMLARITVFIPELLAQARLVDRAQDTFLRTKDPVPDSAAYSSDLQSSEHETNASSPQAKRAADTNRNEEPFDSLGLAQGRTHKKRTRKAQLIYASTLSSHLMEWGMEKSLITATSMIARGYGSRKRTSYRRTRLTLRDVRPLALILVLGITSLICAFIAGFTFTFYPRLSEPELWIGYLPLILYCLIPLVLQIGEELAWWRSR